MKAKIIKEKYLIVYELYDRFGPSTTCAHAFKARSLFNAYAFIHKKHGYGGDLADTVEEFGSDVEALRETVAANNGDGCDYVTLFMSLTTGKVYGIDDEFGVHIKDDTSTCW